MQLKQFKTDNKWCNDWITKSENYAMKKYKTWHFLKKTKKSISEFRNQCNKDKIMHTVLCKRYSDLQYYVKDILLIRLSGAKTNMFHLSVRHSDGTLQSQCGVF